MDKIRGKTYQLEKKPTDRISLQYIKCYLKFGKKEERSIGVNKETCK
jgi:hypothetical protein